MAQLLTETGEGLQDETGAPLLDETPPTAPPPPRAHHQPRFLTRRKVA
jgi:hypothetical protein